MASSGVSEVSEQRPLSTRVGHALAKFLRINVHASRPPNHDAARAESIRSLSLGTEIYNEPDPTVAEYLSKFTPSAGGVGRFIKQFFPFTSWIHRYNRQWLYGDLVAGITVGCVVVPQGMAYSKLAQLPAEFGLYSSFVGVVVYWFFATSKDITIGPVAVMSTLVGNIVAKYDSDLIREQVASALALICGCIVFAIGFFRLGFIVDFISLPAIAAFMTGSAINIAVGQVPTMMGYSKKFNTRGATYMVFINSLKHLPDTTIDAAMGLTALFLLYFLRWFFASFLARRYPKHQKAWFFLNTLRTVFTILLYTMVSWLVNMHRRSDPLFSILKTVPRGFKHMGVPKMEADFISSFASELPAAVIVLLIEHIAISKSFGRVNNYTINPSQELVAIGITNIIGPFFGAYPATGSFSRTAIKSKSGVRTPFAGVITGLVVLLAIYCLTAVFYYIPNASLAAVIIHAVGDLITPPDTVYRFWRVSPIECVIFFVGVIVTVFASIEIGIYVTICVSLAVLLFRIAKARGHFLGKVKVHTVVGVEQFLSSPSGSELNLTQLSVADETKESLIASKSLGPRQSRPSTTALSRSLDSSSSRTVFLPLDHRDGSNPSIAIVSPYPGIFVYRFSEGFNYPNAAHYTEHLVSHIFSLTRRGNLNSYASPGDRPWNDPGPKDPEKDYQEMRSRPTLKAIILDMSSVNNVDITSVQNLIDVRNQLDRYAAPEKVEWHFAAISNRWTKRALASAGFGWTSDVESGRNEGWKPVFSVAEVGASEEFEEAREEGYEKDDDLEAQRRLTESEGDGEERRSDVQASGDGDDEIQKTSVSGNYGGCGKATRSASRRIVPVGSVARPFFHVDLEGAVRSAITSINGV